MEGLRADTGHEQRSGRSCEISELRRSRKWWRQARLMPSILLALMVSGCAGIQASDALAPSSQQVEELKEEAHERETEEAREEGGEGRQEAKETGEEHQEEVEQLEEEQEEDADHGE